MRKEGFRDLGIIGLLFALVIAGGLLASGKVDALVARITWLIDWFTR
ncbi:MAG: hypothetical protein KAI98_06450 [Gemmatimonadetes bacterium]|nr:hypothetical protein [Gemmatimonadota bacterium]MCK5489608.1 hypothetical protein [Gemmatimonadota bacterium]